jgi:ComEC/Rec2-related protein
MPVRRPLVGITLCFMTGLVLGRWLPVSRVLLVAACWGALCFHLWLCRLKTPSSLNLRSGALLLLVLLLGWIRVESNPLPGVDSVVTQKLSDPVEITGIVAEDPLPERNHRGAAYRFPLRVGSVSVDGTAPVPVQGQIEVLWFGSLAYGISPAYGERWSIEGPLRAKRRFGRNGRYLMVSSNRKSQRLSRGVMAAVVQFCLGLRHGAAETLRVGIEDYPESVGMVQALLLGYRSELSAEAHRLFVQTGTLHIFAISGLHVGIVVGLIVFVLAAMSVPRQCWVFVVAPLLIAYTLMTGMKPSAIRACIMAIVFLAAAALHRRADSLSALAFAALLLLSTSPTMLTSPSFVLSFSVVAGIILLFSHIDRLVRPIWAPDPLIVEREKKSTRLLRGIGKHVAALAAVSVSAWLISAPLIACYFGRVAPVALIANIFVVPMAFLVVLSGSLAIVLGFFVSITADIFNHATLALTHGLMAGLRALAWIPGGCLKVGPVPLWIPALWYGSIALLLLYAHVHFPRRDQPGLDVSEQ